MKEDRIAEIEVRYSHKTLKKFRTKINDSKEAYDVFFNSWNKDLIELQEEFKLLLLNNSNEVLGIHNLSKGSTNGTLVDVRLLFAIALKSNASSIIIAHNHPSGNLDPSKNDIKLTDKIEKAGELIGVKLLDHLIITTDGFKSILN